MDHSDCRNISLATTRDLALMKPPTQDVFRPVSSPHAMSNIQGVQDLQQSRVRLRHHAQQQDHRHNAPPEDRLCHGHHLVVADIAATSRCVGMSAM